MPCIFASMSAYRSVLAHPGGIPMARVAPGRAGSKSATNRALASKRHAVFRQKFFAPVKKQKDGLFVGGEKGMLKGFNSHMQHREGHNVEHSLLKRK